MNTVWKIAATHVAFFGAFWLDLHAGAHGFAYWWWPTAWIIFAVYVSAVFLLNRRHKRNTRR